MALMKTHLKVATFNCRSVKSSVDEVKQSCDSCDIVMLQEHWLMPHELGMLSRVHPEFLSVAKSAVNVTENILIGRPYGGTAVLYRKDMAPNVMVVDSLDPRVCAVKMLTNCGPVLFICVYLRADTGDAECVENYTATCAHITALCEDCDAIQYVIAGDFNCHSGSRFYSCLQNFVADNKLCMTDNNRLVDVVTFCNDAGTASSWIDHVLCSSVVDRLVCSVDVMEEYVSSDHKPLAVMFNNLVIPNVTCQGTSTGCDSGIGTVIDWSKADDVCISNYKMTLDSMLNHLNIPIAAFNGCDLTDSIRYEIDEYYSSFMSCVVNACHRCLPARQINPMRDYVIPGWNDIVSDKHKLARDAYLAWIAVGKQRSGPEYWLMKRSRARFKLAIRYCKQHEDSIRSNIYANSLAAKDYKKFWSDIRKSGNDRSTLHATSVGGCNGDSAITEMWQEHYQQLYNSVLDSETKDSLIQRITDVSSGRGEVIISITDVVEACAKQKCGKAVGLDGVAMEAFVYGGHRLHVHFCMLLNMFLSSGYVPDTFMKCVIVPLVKCKTGDLSDVNNYRAIAISTAVSKLFESVLSRHIKTDDYFDAYQFGFTSGCSTSLCTSVFKRTVDCYTHGGSHVFVSFLDFSKAFDKVSYWKLFHKLLDDNVDVGIVRLLAFWYSKQQMCIRWHDCLSQFFTLGNGTRQGGVLSPWLFARYIRDLLSEVVRSKVGCNIGGMFVNILAYADDIVLMAPSWRGLQRLLDVVVQQSKAVDMSLNARKSVCMVFSPRDRSKVVSSAFPQFNVGSEMLQFVPRFKYLGHMILSSNTDDADIQREVTNMFVRTNILIRKFSKCSADVKIVLFKAYCICLYDASLWKCYNLGSLNKMRSCYNRCIKMFFGFKRRDSLTNILMTLGLPSFDTLLVNAVASFMHLWNICCNRIVIHLRDLNSNYWL
jgi:endonuclease/exonuclease/phosphatase family metal-dependent hydrolase